MAERFEIDIVTLDGKSTASFKNLEKQAKSTEKKVGGTFDKIKANWLSMTVGIAAGGIALKKSFDFAETAAKFKQQEQAFANVATSYGKNSKDMINSLRELSGGALTTSQIMESAGNAMVLGIPAERLDKMMEIARASSKITGQSVGKSFGDIALGVGRGSKMILDNLGIMLDIDKANQDYAATLGITAAELTDVQKKTAFLNATMEAGDVIVNRIGVTTVTSADKFAQFRVSIEGAKIEMGKLLLEGINFFGFFRPEIVKSNGLWAKQTEAVQKAKDKIEGLQGGLAGILKLGGDTTRQQALYNKQIALAEIELQKVFAENAKQKQQAIDKNKAEEKSAAAREKEKTDLKELTELEKLKEQARSMVDVKGTAVSLVSTDQSEGERIALQQESEFTQLIDFELRKTEFLQAQREAELISEEQFRERLGQVHEDSENAKQVLSRQTASRTLGMASSMFQNLLVLTGGKSKALFKIMKAAAIAEALVSARTSVVNSYRSGSALGGPIVGALFAAAAATATAAQIQQVSSTKLGGGGTVSAGGSASPSFTGGGSSAQGIPTRLETDERAKELQNITVNVHNPLSSDNWDAISEDIVDSINRAGDRNVNLNVVNV